MNHQKFWKKYHKTPTAEQEALMLSYMEGLSAEDLIGFWNEPSGLKGTLGDLKTKEKKFINAMIDEQIEALDEQIDKIEAKLGRAAA